MMELASASHDINDISLAHDTDASTSTSIQSSQHENAMVLLMAPISTM